MSILVTNPGYCDRTSDITVSWTNNDSIYNGHQSSYEIQYKVPSATSWSTLGTVTSSNTSCTLNGIFDAVGEDAEEYYFRLCIKYNLFYSSSLGANAGGTDYSDVYSIAFHGKQVGTIKAYTGSTTIQMPVYDSVKGSKSTLNAMVSSSTKGQAPLVSSSSPFTSNMKTSHGNVARGDGLSSTRRGYANGYFYGYKYRYSNYYVPVYGYNTYWYYSSTTTNYARSQYYYSYHSGDTANYARSQYYYSYHSGDTANYLYRYYSYRYYYYVRSDTYSYRSYAYGTGLYYYSYIGSALIDGSYTYSVPVYDKYRSYYIYSYNFHVPRYSYASVNYYMYKYSIPLIDIYYTSTGSWNYYYTGRYTFLSFGDYYYYRYISSYYTYSITSSAGQWSYFISSYYYNIGTYYYHIPSRLEKYAYRYYSYISDTSYSLADVTKYARYSYISSYTPYYSYGSYYVYYISSYTPYYNYRSAYKYYISSYTTNYAYRYYSYLAYYNIYRRNNSYNYTYYRTE